MENFQRILQEGWSEQKLSDICAVDWGNTDLTKSSYIPNGKYLAVSATGPDGRIDQSEYKKGTPVLSAIGANCGRMFSPDEDFTAIKNTIVFDSLDGKSDPGFLFYLLSSIDIPKRGGAQPFISKGDLQNLKVIIPEKVSEQKKIADILSEVDNEIQKIDATISVAEKLRTGLMFDFFVEEPRHKKADKKTLKEALELVIDHRGLTPKKLGGDWSLLGIPTISAMNVKNGRIVKPEEIRFVDESLYRKWMPEEIREGDVLLTSEAPLGQSYVVKAGEKFCLSQRLFGLRPDPRKISGEYLYYFLTSPIGAKRLFDRATGSTAKGIRQTELLKVEVNPPGLSRQKEISSMLASVDSKISVNQAIKEKLEILKKGLMNDLLSGRVKSIK